MWVPLCESGLGGGWWPSTPVPCIRVTTPSHTNIVRFRALLQNTCGRMMASKRSRESDHSDEAEADPRPASAVNIGGSAVMMVVTLANSKYNKIYREILVNVKRRVVPAPDSTHTDARTPSRTRARATHTQKGRSPSTPQPIGRWCTMIGSMIAGRHVQGAAAADACCA